MPLRDDIRSVLVIGSGPIVIGQACEFDYSGTQACRVLRDEGLRVILVNSNPATIMTDPEFADATYVEPITVDIVEQIIAKERPDALLPTLGGQTALNTAIALAKAGILDKYDVELIGADIEAIERGENREVFKGIVESIGAESARSRICHTVDECFAAAEELGYPVVVRPSFTMGGAGSGFAHTPDELRAMAGAGLLASPTTEVLLEESIMGWKEYELELMRDHNDNVVVVCSIENLDPMGVHTGDSITVAPALTLTDREYQRLRDIGIDIIRAVGVDTGGCNIQFAVDPEGRPDHRHRDEPPRLAVQRTGQQGDRVPDRQDRRAPGRGLQPRRDPQRHHPGDAGLVRAGPRLRRGQGAPLRVREVPERRRPAHHHDEERRRGHGHRPQLHRGAAEGAAQPGAQGRPVRVGRQPACRPGGTAGRGRGAPRQSAPTGAAGPVGRRQRRTGAPGHGDRSVVPRPDRPAQRHRRADPRDLGAWNPA